MDKQKVNRKNIRIPSECLLCMGRNLTAKFPEDASEEQRIRFIQGVYELLGGMSLTDTAPKATRDIMHLREEMFGPEKDYASLKSRYNAKVMKYEDRIRAEIQAAPDPLKRAIQYSIYGNYIDFTVPQGVEDEKLEALLEASSGFVVDEKKLEAIRRELSGARELFFLLDNCGEIVLDKLFMEEIRREFPDIAITAVVRGGDFANDVTVKDAEETRLSEVAEILPNGDDIGGTMPERMSEEARNRLLSAKLIFAKGEGNFETLWGCGWNIYYFFLCKCELFANRFRVPPNTGMIVHDSEV